MSDNATLGVNARMAMDTITGNPTKGIASWLLHPLEHSILERYAGAQPGDYKSDPESVYIRFQHNIGTCMIDQYIPDNPLSMGDAGYEGATHGTTTGATRIVCNGITIDSPEAVIEHMERYVFPDLLLAIDSFDHNAYVQSLIADHNSVQAKLGPDILKAPYAGPSFPYFIYSTYGYVNYFSAYALYPEVMEKHFKMQSDLAVKVNTACAEAVVNSNMPPLFRLDHDMADSRSTLVDIKSLDSIWFPHFARSIKPLLDAGIKLIWHCDGNLMEMVPRLLDCGIAGFQGFQYEDGMDYKQICSMKTSHGEELLIIGGVSVTRTLPFGTPEDVKHELEFLVEYGPKRGLMLGGSSSITPGVTVANMDTLIEGLEYYRTNGRG